jgi:hypothetical protein
MWPCSAQLYVLSKQPGATAANVRTRAYMLGGAALSSSKQLTHLWSHVFESPDSRDRIVLTQAERQSKISQHERAALVKEYVLRPVACRRARRARHTFMSKACCAQRAAVWLYIVQMRQLRRIAHTWYSQRLINVLPPLLCARRSDTIKFKL